MSDKHIMISPEKALPGRDTPLTVDDTHFVNQSSISAAPTTDQAEILIGMGCFWGAERLFWQLDGVVSTSVGYSGGYTENPTYEEVCSGKTGHAEVVRVVYSPEKLSLQQLLTHFWERHDPTQGMQQGNDIGTQYRSALYVYDQTQMNTACESKEAYQNLLGSDEKQQITTEILPAGKYYFAENYHQQYLAKNPEGYCGLGGTGVCFPPSLSN
ncbi:peptide-methionine (S)-S-oxide reductase MsrA [Vibrio agarivorans]|uniref:Peptide methionine sulfoxide reductase MsrA n=1 Tax=Vibrio agarivorans TaxID=153622 RepID=A0ABT7Y2G7_9VIBR|nr:peptide-methionine (S)-S-oxide reductase MsrA [Vibrio agarivorans]MDN2482176.1 peptide-methionine (S)-S-oxide reductase MsrA [Vibrio agarivorans]